MNCHLSPGMFPFPLFLPTLVRMNALDTGAERPDKTK